MSLLRSYDVFWRRFHNDVAPDGAELLHERTFVKVEFDIPIWHFKSKHA